MSEESTNELDSICPIYGVEDDMTVQIGTGVVVDIGGKIFILTAAHVLDWKSSGPLMVPTEDGIEEIRGVGASLQAKQGVSGKRDVYDVAYLLLQDSFAIKFVTRFPPVPRDEIWYTDNMLPDDTYSFSGFPITKATRKGVELSGEIFSYTGEAAIPRKYETLGYDENVNIVVNFRRKKSKGLDDVKRIPPHPKGISGGAVFRWPKTLEGMANKRLRYLAGIGHTYISQHNCLVGTQIWFVLKFISNKYPELFLDRRKLESNEIPLFNFVVGYKKDEWDILLENFEDSGNMQNSWAEWRNAAETFVENMSREGAQPLVYTITNDEILAYCKESKLPNIGKTRLQLANKKFHDSIKEVDL